MTAEEGAGLKRTPLHGEHVRLGARMFAFAGWEMPLEYEGILAEHRAVRERAGLFDVSHMGRFELRGPEAEGLLDFLVVGSVADLPVGRARYTLMCRPDGGVLDDLIVYRLEAERYLLIVNAANRAKDAAWIAEHGRGGVALLDRTEETALLALQGPQAVAILGRLGTGWEAFPRFGVGEAFVAGVPAVVARTGYTGEDGFEIMVSAGEVGNTWCRLLAEGRPHGLSPAGLGARDTLRLEAGLPLYGHELREDVSPLEAGLERLIDWRKGFVGREALVAERERGPRRRLVGLRLSAGGIPRAGYPVFRGDEEVGVVTSGGPSPTLGGGIALALVAAGAAEAERLAVGVRGRRLPAEVVRPPFYRRRGEG